MSKNVKNTKICKQLAQIWCVCEAAGHKLQRLLVGACGKACDMHAGRCYLSGLQSLPYAS